MLVFTANPEDYTARGKIITPLKDRIGSEIRTHYPATVEQGIAITEQEAWTERTSPIRAAKCPTTSARSSSSWRSWRAKTSAWTSAPASRQRLPISVLENVISNAERRALKAGEERRRAARAGHLRRAALHHRQAGAGIRRRAEGRRRTWRAS